MNRLQLLIYSSSLTVMIACGNTSDLVDTHARDSGSSPSTDNPANNATNDTDTSMQPAGTDSEKVVNVVDGPTSEDTAACVPDSYACNENVLMRCVNEQWQEWDDCLVYGKKCTVAGGVFQCIALSADGPEDSQDTNSDYHSDPIVHGSDSESESESESASNLALATDVDTATDADTDTQTESDTQIEWASECDGPEKDCYSECWECATHAALCRPRIEDCMANGRCASYYNCQLKECCAGDESHCLTGDDWLDCMNDCAAAADATDETLKLYRAIDKCIACDACAISCAQGESADFAMCADEQAINTPNNPCYEKDADEGETACFSWAGWGGPCTDSVINCKNDKDCDDLEQCINETWSTDDWETGQEACFEAFGSAAEARYWDYMQCIYCDACDVACIKDAGSKNCEYY